MKSEKLTFVCVAIIGALLIMTGLRAPVEAKPQATTTLMVADTVVRNDYAGFLVHSKSEKNGSAQLSVSASNGEPALMFYDAGEANPSIAMHAGGLQVVTGDGNIHFIDLNELAALDTSAKPGVVYSRTRYRNRVIEAPSRK